MEISRGYKMYNRDEIIELVQKFYKKNRKIVIRDLRHKNGLPSVTQVIDLFGSFQNCIKEAGIPTDDRENLFKRECLSDEEMLSSYKKFVEEHLKTHIYLPTNDEVDACSYVQSTGTYVNRFGSFENINKLIGYDQKEFNNSALEKDMIFKYKRACQDNGHVLSSREITKLSKENKDYIYSTEAYINHFGSLHDLQELCGFDKTIPGKGASKEELIEKLQWLGNIIGRKPVQGDLKLYRNVPSVNCYCDNFGSFREALKEAGYDGKRILKTKNGTLCRSTFELKLAQIFESYGIEYENEILYRLVIPTFKKKYRFDFSILINGNKYYIEMFGIEGNELYEKRKQEKIDVCNKHSVPLIQLYQSDIYAKTNEEIYNYIMNYIKDIEKEVA